MESYTFHKNPNRLKDANIESQKHIYTHKTVLKPTVTKVYAGRVKRSNAPRRQNGSTNCLVGSRWEGVCGVYFKAVIQNTYHYISFAK